VFPASRSVALGEDGPASDEDGEAEELVALPEASPPGRAA
jgi:hypothetical protein